MKFSHFIILLFFFRISIASEFGLSGIIYAVSTSETPTFSPPNTVLTHTLTQLKIKGGESIYICPFLSDRSYQSIVSIAETALLSGKEVFISTVKTDYNGRAITSARYGKNMFECGNGISLYKI